METQGRARGAYSVVATIVNGMTFESSLGIVGSNRVWVLYQRLKQGKRGFQSNMMPSKLQNTAELLHAHVCAYINTGGGQFWKLKNNTNQQS